MLEHSVAIARTRPRCGDHLTTTQDGRAKSAALTRGRLCVIIKRLSPLSVQAATLFKPITNAAEDRDTISGPRDAASFRDTMHGASGAGSVLATWEPILGRNCHPPVTIRDQHTASQPGTKRGLMRSNQQDPIWAVDRFGNTTSSRLRCSSCEGGLERFKREHESGSS